MIQKFFVIDRDTRAIMFEVHSIQEGKEKIQFMIEEDREFGFFAEELYDLVDENKNSVLY